MDKKEGSKIAIIGAGSVGAAVAFVMSIKQTCAELVLIDVNTDKAQGEVLDISHGLPFLGHMNIHAGDYSDVKDCDIIIVTAGIPRMSWLKYRTGIPETKRISQWCTT